jgi:asparagine synthase (glutamine-hydrolysing)
MDDGTDIKYARMVAEHIGSIHTEFNFTPNDGLNSIDDVLLATETFDITTIRASVGQYLLAKKIASTTDIKVILNGDGADECQMGYLYFYLYPSIAEAKIERDKLLNQIHLFDGLRVDRNISYHGLEARVPFLDKEFVNLYYKIPPELLVPTPTRMEKHLIRTAFNELMPDLLPYDVLFRKKEAFSDGVSSKEKSWYMIVKDHYNQIIFI